MVEDKRLTYARKWFLKGATVHDPFDRFIYSWISLVIAAQRLGRSPVGERDTDRERILDYFRLKSNDVFQVLQENRDRMFKLARRRGSHYGGRIVDTGSNELQSKFYRLAEHYTFNRPLDRDDLVEYTGELLNKIRNNLFHGEKVYDDREDIALLKLVTPILQGILAKCEGFERPKTPARLAR